LIPPGPAGDIVEVLTRPEPCLFPSFGPNTLCFNVTTEEAQLIARPVMPLDSERYSEITIDGGVFGGYSFAFLPYLPHGAPVWCCGG
jgi:hypothetical protein